MFQRNPDEFLHRFIIGRNIDPLFHIQDEGTVKMKYFPDIAPSDYHLFRSMTHV